MDPAGDLLEEGHTRVQTAQQRVAALRQEYEALQRSPLIATPVPRVTVCTTPGAPAPVIRQPGGITDQPLRDLAPAGAKQDSRSIPNLEGANRGDSRTAPVVGASNQQSRPPPGLSNVLGREPPSAARTWGPAKTVADLSSLRPPARGVSSGERSDYFAQYRQTLCS